jgi:hypothetical protein
MRALLLVALLSFAVTSVSRSQEPAPHAGTQQEQPQATKPDESGHTQQNAAPSAPAVINTQPAHKSTDEAEEERRERREKAELDRRLVDLTAELSEYTGGLYRATVALVIATVAIAIATLGLVLFAFIQSRDMKESLLAAAKSAAASENNVSIALATQRAQLGILKFVTEIVGDDSLIGFTVQAIWKNFGNLAARKINLNIQVVAIEPDRIGELTFRLKSVPLGENDLVPGDDASSVQVPIRADQAVAVFEKRLRVFIYSRVAYNDVIELQGPQRLATEVCNEVLFGAHPNLLVLPGRSGVGPFTTQMKRFAGPYRVIDGNAAASVPAA